MSYTLFVVVSYGHLPSEELLTQAGCQPGAPSEVVVVDNSDEYDQHLANLQDCRADSRRTAHTAWPGGNVGYARACNFGVAAGIATFGEPELVVFCNSDIRVGPSLAAELRAFSSARPEAAILGPNLRSTEGLSLQAPTSRPVFLRDLLSPLSKRDPDPVEQPPQRVYQVQGACFAMPFVWWARVGGLDPFTFLYAEEAILGERVLLAGGEVWTVPTSIVSHLRAEHGESAIAKHITPSAASWLSARSMAYYYSRYQRITSPAIAAYLALRYLRTARRRFTEGRRRRIG